MVYKISKANYISWDMFKDGVVIIDLGMNRNVQVKRCGDVDFESVLLSIFITSVPGEVGLMTITMPLENTVRAAKFQNNIAL